MRRENPLVDRAEGKNGPPPTGVLSFATPRRAPGPPGDMKPPRLRLSHVASRTATASDEVPHATRSPPPDHPGEAASARCSWGHVRNRDTRGTSDATQRRRRTERRTMSVGTRGITTTVPGIWPRGVERPVHRSREAEGVGTGRMRRRVRGERDRQLRAAKV